MFPRSIWMIRGIKVSSRTSIVRNSSLKQVSQTKWVVSVACPTDAEERTFNTTLETLGVPPTYWRDSLLRNTSVFYSCQGSNPERCNATSASVTSPPDDYCAPEFKGPLCKLCKNENQYFNESDGKCSDCKDWYVSLVLHAIGVGVALVAFLGFWVLTPRFMGWK